MKRVLSIAGIAVILLASGFLLYKHFVTDQIVDVPGMENPAAPMLDLLSAEWRSEDGVWSAHIDVDDHCTLYLSYQQELVYSGNFSFDFYGDDPNVKTELNFYDKDYKSEDSSISSTIESLYVENCRIYLDITVSKEGENSMRQQVVLERAEYDKPTENESEGIREVSEMAELVEFSWNQGAMSYDDSFDFSITHTITPDGQETARRLCCDYTDPKTGERIKIGEESSDFQGFGLGGTRTDSAVCLSVPLERWDELADFLRTAELSPYHPPEPGLMDASNSRIVVTWQVDGEEFTNRYSWGTSAHDLLELLQDIAREAIIQKSDELQPTPEGSGTCS